MWLRYRCAVALAAIVLVPTVSVAQEERTASLSELVDRAKDAVVSIHSYDARGVEIGSGTGFLLEDGRVATNAHVLQDVSRVEVVDSEGHLLGTATFAENLSSRVDVAVLPRLGSPPAVLPISDMMPAVGERIVVIGSPRGLANTVTDGIVSAYRTLDDKSLMQVTAPISPGSSGSPVLDARGAVVGMTVGMFESGQNLNFAVPVRDIRAVTASPPGRVAFPGATPAGAGSAQTTASEPDVREIAVGDRVEGHLDASDIELEDESYADLLVLEASSGQTVTIELRSEAFDAYLAVTDTSFDESGFAAEDDDSGDGTNASLTVTFPHSGQYYVIANSYEAGESGPYVLTVTRAVSSASDSRWSVVGRTDNGVMSMDQSSIRAPESGRYHVWTRIAYDARQTTDAGQSFDRIIVDFEIDCDRRRSRIHDGHYYDNGEILDSWGSDEPGDWNSWVPESVGEALGEAVCSSTER